jgi:hypothetical protein
MVKLFASTKTGVRSSRTCCFVVASLVSWRLIACIVTGENLRYLPLSDRKHRLKGIVPHWGQRLLYCDHIDGMGGTLFQLACERDLEGIVAKRQFDPYLLDGSASWLKIKNSNYSQWAGREELFDRERSTDPDGWGWESCAIACESVLA